MGRGLNGGKGGGICGQSVGGDWCPFPLAGTMSGKMIVLTCGAGKCGRDRRVEGGGLTEVRVAKFLDNQPVGPVSFSARQHFVRESDSAALRGGMGWGGERRL